MGGNDIKFNELKELKNKINLQVNKINKKKKKYNKKILKKKKKKKKKKYNKKILKKKKKIKKIDIQLRLLCIHKWESDYLNYNVYDRPKKCKKCGLFKY